MENCNLVLHLLVIAVLKSLQLCLSVKCLCLTEFILGECQKLHIHIQRIPVDNIPKDADIFKIWLSDQFVKKEK